VRLLPIVIFATAALLVFKGVGIITQGGYVFSGAGAAHAAEATVSDGSTPSIKDAAPRTEPTMSDTSPTLTDAAPTLPLTPAKAASAQKSDAPGNAVAAATMAGAPAPAPAATPTAAAALPPDATPMQGTYGGKPVPLASDGDSGVAGDEVLQSLAERRAELDKREASLNMREAVVKAAEQQMASRANALKALQSQISTIQQKQQSTPDEQMAGIVKLYENMKPQDAAAIFDGLDLNVLQHVAKAMDPRKMSPILAKMNPQKAQQLTTQLAAGDLAPPPEVSSVAATDANALPQIVGH